METKHCLICYKSNDKSIVMKLKVITKPKNIVSAERAVIRYLQKIKIYIHIYIYDDE